MSDAKPSDEPSIEEILGSIRRIIADDETPAATGNNASPLESYDDEDDDVPLELTQKLDEDGTVIDLHKTSDRDDTEDQNLSSHSVYAEAPAMPVTPQQTYDDEITDDEVTVVNFSDQDTAVNETLVSNVAANATAAVFAKLARNTAINRSGHEGATIEDLVKDMLRPMLSDWLDDNLPEMVQNMVERELEKISRRVG